MGYKFRSTNPRSLSFVNSKYMSLLLVPHSPQINVDSNVSSNQNKSTPSMPPSEPDKVRASMDPDLDWNADFKKSAGT